MLDEEEHQPGDRAPATAHSEELNVFGTQREPLSMFMKATDFRVRRAALRGGGYGRKAVNAGSAWNAILTIALAIQSLCLHGTQVSAGARDRYGGIKWSHGNARRHSGWRRPPEPTRWL